MSTIAVKKVKRELRWLLAVVGIVAALNLSGCETIKKAYAAGTVTTSANVTNKIVVDAEKLTLIGKDTFETFLRLEKDHRVSYGQISPEPYKLSVRLRTRVPDPTQIIPPGSDPPTLFIPQDEAWLKMLRKATKAFKANRTPTSEADLMTAYNTVKSVIEDCQRYTAKITTGAP